MPARILPPTPDNISLAAEALLRGEVVAMPTETVYGLAGLALDEGALAKIFSTKDRPTFDPLIVHVGAPNYESFFDLPDQFWHRYLEDELELVAQGGCKDRWATLYSHQLMTLWPGPLTIVLPKSERVPDLATAGLPTVAIRSPRHFVAQALLREVGQPLAAPSANRFGRISPTCAADVAAELGDRIDIILDGGPCEIGLESTVVEFGPGNDEITLLRPGFFTREFLEEKFPLFQFVVPQPADSANPTAPQASPGMLASHYAPAKPLYLLPAAFNELTPEQHAKIAQVVAGSSRIGLLRCSPSSQLAPRDGTSLAQREGYSPEIVPVVERSLSKSGNPAKAARNLFHFLRQLDADPRVEVILAEPIPDETGLWHAIADRLRRASSSWE